MRFTQPVDGSTLPAQVSGMASSTQTVPSAEWTDLLPSVHLDVRQGSRSASYALDDVDFLIGSMPGCDLRVAAEAPAVL